MNSLTKITLGNMNNPTKIALGFIILCWLFVGSYELIITHNRNNVWHDEESLWSATVGTSPHNGRAWMNLGVAKMGKGKFTEAEYDFERARLYAPQWSLVEVNLGVLCAALNRDDEAKWHLEKALKMNPGDINSHSYYEQLVRYLKWKQGEVSRELINAGGTTGYYK